MLKSYVLNRAGLEAEIFGEFSFKALAYLSLGEEVMEDN